MISLTRHPQSCMFIPKGINIFDFSLIDNSEVIELLEGRLGLINQLNEECVRPNGGDESFVYKLKVVNSDSRCMVNDKLHYPYEFAIRHYAAPIKVSSIMLMAKNLCLMHDPLNMPDTTHYSMMPDILSSATWIRYRQI